MSSQRLVTLPAETFERIAQLAHPQDLLQLRLTCRAAAEKAKRTFIQAYFTERAFLVSNEDSLRCLLAIAEDQILGHAMKKIILCVEEVPDPANDLYWYPRQREQVRHADAMMKWRTAHEVQTRMRDQNVNLHLLTIIFARFRNLNNVVEVKLMDQGDTTVMARGTRSFELLTGQKLQLPDTGDSRAVDTVLEALVLSGLPVETLSVRFDDWDWNRYWLVHTEITKAQSTNVFQNVKQLNMQPALEFEVREGATYQFVHLIASAPNLKSLTLQAGGFYSADTVRDNDDDVMDLLTQKHLPALEVLQLRQLRFRFMDMVHFLRRHDSINRVAFNSCIFYAMKLVGNPKPGSVDDALEVVKRLTGKKDVSMENCSLEDREELSAEWT